MFSIQQREQALPFIRRSERSKVSTLWDTVSLCWRPIHIFVIKLKHSFCCHEFNCSTWLANSDINNQSTTANDISDVVRHFNDSSVLVPHLVEVWGGGGAKLRGWNLARKSFADKLLHIRKVSIFNVPAQLEAWCCTGHAIFRVIPPKMESRVDQGFFCGDHCVISRSSCWVIWRIRTHGLGRGSSLKTHWIEPGPIRLHLNTVIAPLWTLTGSTTFPVLVIPCSAICPFPAHFICLPSATQSLKPSRHQIFYLFILSLWTNGYQVAAFTDT